MRVMKENDWTQMNADKHRLNEKHYHEEHEGSRRLKGERFTMKGMKNMKENLLATGEHR